MYSPFPALIQGFALLLMAAVVSGCSHSPNSQSPRAPATITHQQWTSEMHEDDHDFLCPEDEVLVGRSHKGDENGPTRYLCGKIFQFVDIKVKAVQKSDDLEEADGVRFVCPENQIMTGRGHSGDENGQTWYYCAKADDYWGNPLTVAHGLEWGEVPNEELEHTVTCSENAVMVGRYHKGDETKPTEYLCAYLY